MPKFIFPVPVLLLLLTLAPAHAQNFSSLGVRGGWSSACTNAGGDKTSGSREAFTGGLTCNWNLGWAFKLRMEVLFSRKGGYEVYIGRIAYMFDDAPLLVDARLDYLELPLLAKWHPGGGPAYLTAGPFAGVLIRRKLENSQNYPDDFFNAPNCEIRADCSWSDYLDHLSDMDSGFILGMGYEFKLGKRVISLDAQYHHGLKDINKFLDLVLRTRLVSVTASVMLF